MCCLSYFNTGYEPEDLEPILVDPGSVPPGVSFTECVTHQETGHCCIDLVGEAEFRCLWMFFWRFSFNSKVEEIQSEVRDPVLECVTRQEVTCHTSHVTNYVPKTGRVRRRHRLLHQIKQFICRSVRQHSARSVTLC